MTPLDEGKTLSTEEWTQKCKPQTEMLKRVVISEQFSQISRLTDQRKGSTWNLYPEANQSVFHRPGSQKRKRNPVIIIATATRVEVFLSGSKKPEEPSREIHQFLKHLLAHPDLLPIVKSIPKKKKVVPVSRVINTETKKPGDHKKDPETVVSKVIIPESIQAGQCLGDIASLGGVQLSGEQNLFAKIEIAHREKAEHPLWSVISLTGDEGARCATLHYQNGGVRQRVFYFEDNRLVVDSFQKKVTPEKMMVKLSKAF